MEIQNPRGPLKRVRQLQDLPVDRNGNLLAEGDQERSVARRPDGHVREEDSKPGKGARFLECKFFVCVVGEWKNRASAPGLPYRALRGGGQQLPDFRLELVHREWLRQQVVPLLYDVLLHHVRIVVARDVEHLQPGL